MSDVVMATSAADAAAAEAVEAHHAELAAGLAERVEALVSAAGRGDPAAAGQARGALVDWCRHELVPHARAEEEVLYPPAADREDAGLLVRSMTDEHETLTGLVDEVAAAADDTRAATSATALRVVFDSHLAKENELVLPLLAGAADVSLAELLEGMHELLGAHGHEPHDDADQPGLGDEGRPAHGGGGCGCGHSDEEPELDARTIPHEVRPATLMTALESVQPGASMVLVAPHDPVPILDQIERRNPGGFEVEYLQRGPDAWRLRFSRRRA